MSLPDSRAKYHSHTIKVRGVEYERIYCINCCCAGGHVRAEAIPFVFYLCEQCAENYGRISAPEIPEELLRGV